MLTHPLTPSTSVQEAGDRFFDAVGAWIDDCIARYSDQPATDVHDQGTFTTGWRPYIEAKSDAAALTFMTTLRDKIRDHHVARGAWQHGYWRMQEAHHGTEHYELFLGTLLRLQPDDSATGEQLVDAAEHMGNWVTSVEPWFDWDKRLYRSIFFGTDGVKVETGMDLNMPDHLRFANICLLAYQASGEARFLALATAYVGHWAEAVLADTSIPIGLTAAGPLYVLEGVAKATYRSFAGQAPDLAALVDRAENLLCSDAINTFLVLWKHTGEAHFRQASEKLLDALVQELGDPDAGAAADAVRHYRTHTADNRYDQAVLDAVQPLAPETIAKLSIDLPEPSRSRASGIGKRGDAPRWLENDQPRRHNPITLAVAAEISNDAALATQALDLARTYFTLARAVFPDGRDHGCSARSVSAIARGHGRENHAGMTTAVLQPLWTTFGAG